MGSLPISVRNSLTGSLYTNETQFVFWVCKEEMELGTLKILIIRTIYLPVGLQIQGLQESRRQSDKLITDCLFILNYRCFFNISEGFTYRAFK